MDIFIEEAKQLNKQWKDFMEENSLKYIYNIEEQMYFLENLSFLAIFKGKHLVTEADKTVDLLSVSICYNGIIKNIIILAGIDEQGHSFAWASLEGKIVYYSGMEEIDITSQAKFNKLFFDSKLDSESIEEVLYEDFDLSSKVISLLGVAAEE